jgi:hypothetical protein
MSQVETNFIESLVERFPTLQSLLDEHLEDNRVLLPHIFLASLAQIMTETSNKVHSEVDADLPIFDILDFLEEHFEVGSEKLDELISVSFVELFSPFCANDKVMVSRLPPKLSKESERIYSKRN